MHHGGKRVVGRLRHVDVVVRVDGGFRSEFAAEKTDCAVGDDFVDVHVELGARASLPYHEREVLVQFALGDFLCCGLDCFRHLGIESVLHISLR